MADYTETDVTGWTASRLVSLINARIDRYPSVQILKRDRKTVLRTWRVEFDVEEFPGEDDAG